MYKFIICLLTITFAYSENLATDTLSIQQKVTDSTQEVTMVSIQYRDGQEVIAELIKETETTLVLLFGGGSKITVAKNSLKSFERNVKVQRDHSGELRYEDPAESRYLYATSGFMLPKGKVIFSQKELIFSSVHFGVTDNLTLQIGSVLPLLLSGESETNNLILGLKRGGRLMERLSIAGGLQMFVFNNEALVIPFGVLTLGKEGAHVSFNIGAPTVKVFSDDKESKLLLNISGKKRLSKSVALVGEIWRVEKTLLYAPAVRFMGKQFSTDLGFVLTKEMPIPFPWLDFSYSW